MSPMRIEVPTSRSPGDPGLSMVGHLAGHKSQNFGPTRFPSNHPQLTNEKMKARKVNLLKVILARAAANRIRVLLTHPYWCHCYTPARAHAPLLCKSQVRPKQPGVLTTVTSH
jgi:hypothetical protein